MRSAIAVLCVVCLAPVGQASLLSALDRPAAGAGVVIVASVDAAELPRPRPGGPRIPVEGDPFSEVTADSLLAFLDDLTAVGAYEGWRLATTGGEDDAIEYVEHRLSQLGFLRSIGLATERVPFTNYLGVEFWESRLHIRVDGNRSEVPALAEPGHRDVLELAIRFDSDGVLNDSDRNPVEAAGAVVVVRTPNQLDQLTPAQVDGRIVFIDYAVIDRSIIGLNDAVTRAWGLAALGPAAIVVVTEYSNVRGESHGSFVNFLGPFTWVEVDPLPPVLAVRLEDMADAGVTGWNDLNDIEHAELRWDADLYSPGHSAYFEALIPGRDRTRAVILGAHIDSPNTPGAFDNGSGSVALLEVARVLDRSRLVPPVDLHLVWFGSHEVGLYGSSNFTADHSELLDRTVAMLQMDCLGRPLDGISNDITLEAWSYGWLGDDSTPWIGYLNEASADHGIATLPIDIWGLVSDNSSFAGYGVPSANMIYMNPFDPVEVHYGNHLHDPYETVELAEVVYDAFTDMARVLVVAAVEAATDAPDLRVPPAPDRRVLLVGSHTEGVHMSPAGFTEFGMTMAWEGYDVDMIPYGRQLSDADLADTDLVIALPVHDYPSTSGDVDLYEEAWSEAEIDVLEDYVLGGGTLVITSTGHRLKYYNISLEENEDWSEVNDVAERFGVTFSASSNPSTFGRIDARNHPLMDSLSSVWLIGGNNRSFTIDHGEVLAYVGQQPVVAVIDAGAGEVVVLGDLGVLGNDGGVPENLDFWRNLADYAR